MCQSELVNKIAVVLDFLGFQCEGKEIKSISTLDLQLLSLLHLSTD